MKFETDRTKRQTRSAHRERMKRLDKAKKRADDKYYKENPTIPKPKREKRVIHETQDERVDRIRAEHRHEQEQLAEAQFERQWQSMLDAVEPSKKTIAMIVGILGLSVTAMYYAWIAMAWYEAPAYMAFGWLLEKLRQKLKKK